MLPRRPRKYFLKGCGKKVGGKKERAEERLRGNPYLGGKELFTVLQPPEQLPRKQLWFTTFLKSRKLAVSGKFGAASPQR